MGSQLCLANENHLLLSSLAKRPKCTPQSWILDMHWRYTRWCGRLLVPTRAFLIRDMETIQCQWQVATLGLVGVAV